MRTRLRVGVLLLLTGCTAPIHLRRTSDALWFQRESRTALEAIQPSERTLQFLRREALGEEYYRDREGLLHTLHRLLVSTRERIVALHLAELCYHEARQGSHPPLERVQLYLSACQYAYAYLFDEALGSPASPYDPAFRWGCDFYNRALGKTLDLLLAQRDNRPPDEMERGRTYPLLVGELNVRWGVNEYAFRPEDYSRILVGFNYDVSGLPGKARSYGLGVPLILVRAGLAEGFLIQPLSLSGSTPTREDDVEVHQSFPATAILRMPESILEAADGKPRSAWFELYDPSRTFQIRIGQREVALEQELSSALAHTLQQARGTEGFWAFLNPGESTSRTTLSMLQPYDPDKIPVVFVHGLMSSPLTWVGLFNDLLADFELRHRFQFWFFRYPTGYPVAYSASLLRETLLQVQDNYDPEGTNRTFQDMVICGHSMGGLLTKLQIVDGGDHAWHLITEEPLDSLDVPEDTRELLRRIFYFQRQPFIGRVVFMATPHRGSELATSWIGRLGARLVSLPSRFRADSEVMLTYLRNRVRQGLGKEEIHKLTGIASLRPDSPLAEQISKWPLPEGLPVHSIIGNEDAAGVAGGSDGVVPYASAHLEGVESELIIESGHNVQEHPLALKELRRILHLHLDLFDRQGPAGAAPGEEPAVAVCPDCGLPLIRH